MRSASQSLATPQIAHFDLKIARWQAHFTLTLLRAGTYASDFEARAKALASTLSGEAVAESSSQAPITIGGRAPSNGLSAEI